MPWRLWVPAEATRTLSLPGEQGRPSAHAWEHSPDAACHHLMHASGVLGSLSDHLNSHRADGLPDPWPAPLPSPPGLRGQRSAARGSDPWTSAPSADAGDVLVREDVTETGLGWKTWPLAPGVGAEGGCGGAPSLPCPSSGGEAPALPARGQLALGALAFQAVLAVRVALVESRLSWGRCPPGWRMRHQALRPVREALPVTSAWHARRRLLFLTRALLENLFVCCWAFVVFLSFGCGYGSVRVFSLSSDETGGPRLLRKPRC